MKTRNTKGKSVGLICVLCLFAVALLMPLPGHTPRAATGRDRLQSLGGGRYLFSDLRSLPAVGLRRLRIVGAPNIGGHIVVNVGSADSVRVAIDKVLRVDSPQTAREFDAEIAVRLRPDGNALRLDVQTPADARWEGTDWGISLDLKITVPSDWDLDINARYFEYDLQGPFRNVEIDTEFGRVKLSDVAERTDVRGKYTAIELADVRGAITASTTYANLDVRRAIPGPDHPVRLSNISGPISVDGLAGSLLVETQNAHVRLNRISLLGGTSRVVCDGAPVEIAIEDFGHARLEVRTSRAPVSVRVPAHLSARLTLEVGRGGTIHTKGLDIQTHPDLLGLQRLEGVCGQGEGVIDINVSGPSRIDLIGVQAR